MTFEGVWFAVVALGAVLVILKSVQWLRVMNQPDVRRRDESLNVDQWTEERRRGLVDLQRPAVKGYDAASHRHTVTRMVARRDAAKQKVNS